MQAESDVFQYLLKNLSPTCGGLLQKLSKSLNDIGCFERLEKVCSSENFHNYVTRGRMGARRVVPVRACASRASGDGGGERNGSGRATVLSG